MKNMRVRVFVLFLLACAPAFAQVQSGGVALAPGAGIFQVYTAGGTITATHLVILDSSNNVIEAPAGTTTGIIGVAESNATIGLPVNIAFLGQQPISVDNPCTIGNFVVMSSATDGFGDCQASLSGSEIGVSFTTIGSAGIVSALVTTGSGGGGSGGAANITNQANNQVAVGVGPNAIGGTVPCPETGSIMGGINSSPPACNPIGAVGPQITITPYTAQCDIPGTTVMDRGATLKFKSGSGTLVVPRPGDAGCANFTFAVEVEIPSLTVNREVSASYTFSIHGNVTPQTGQTTFTLPQGTWAVFKQNNFGCSPENTCVMDVDVVNGGVSSQVYPAAGVPQSTGSAWGSSLTAPTGALVGTSDTQTLTNKTVDGVSPTTSGFVDPTSSIQTQLNGKSGNIASGTAALGTSSIGSGACATVVTVSASGVASTDIIQFTPNASIKVVAGYTPATAGGLAITAYPTGNNVNFDVCNWSNGSITPGAVTLNWRVSR